LQPLLDGDIVSCYSMTEPDGGSDPGSFTSRAVPDGDDWLINGEKWFSSNLRYAAFVIVMVVTNPGAPLHERFSMFIVPTDTPGMKIQRNVGLWGESAEEGTHGYVRYENVRVPADALLGRVNGGWEVAQSRLGGGRLHHAMRSIGFCQRALDMACERVVSRKSRGQRLADLGVVQDDIARCWIQLQQFRLFVLHTSWLYDQGKREEAWIATAGVKAATADVMHDIIWRCMHLHGSWGVSNELPFASMVHTAAAVAVVDGPTEAHRSLVARTLLKRYEAVDSRQPSEHVPTRRAWAERKLASFFDDPDGG
ncbi:MAG: acyl-CoA dehydrogenase family protein, partial [Steroidobacteraceae bacterium]